MKRIFNITLRAAAVVLTVALAAGCVFEKEDPTLVRGTKKVMVELNVGADDMATKATADSEKDIKDLRIYAFIGDVMVGYANPQSLSDTWYMDLNLPETGTYDIDFWAVANVDGLSDNSITISPNMSKDQLKSIVYNATIVNSDYSDTGFPMYAIHTEQDVDVAAVVKDAGKDAANTSPGHEGHFILNKTVTLNLTRSLSKITVYAAEAVSGDAAADTDDPKVKISGVTIQNAKLASGLFETKTSEVSTINVSPTQPVAVNKTIGLDANTDADNNSIPDIIEDVNNYTSITTPYYIAENTIGSTVWNTAVEGGTYLEISYLLGNSTESKTAIVNMPVIERNKHYKVMARIQANGEVTLTLIVKDWKDIVREEINFEDHVSLSQNITWSGDVNQGTQDGKTVLTFKGTTIGQTATCSFGMDAPKGGTWYVTLTGGNINGFELETTVGGKLIEGTSVSGPINPEQTVEVKVKTLTSTYLKEELRADLQIVAKSVDGRTLAVMDGSRNASFIIVQPSTNN